MIDLAVDCVKSAGEVLLQHFGSGGRVRVKENQASIVTDADLASERIILSKIRARHPDHGIVAEESGFAAGTGGFTWVVDPLDGTSNFAAGIPWFGVILALLEGNVPVVGAMYLPVSDTLYTCEKGGGVFRDGVRVSVSGATELSTVLCAYGLDPSEDAARTAREVRTLEKVVRGVRNVRSTNSLVDFCYTLDGRLGACVNRSSRIWDIAASCLMFPEAGGLLTDARGDGIVFLLDGEVTARSYSVVGANPALHASLMDLISVDE